MRYVGFDSHAKQSTLAVLERGPNELKTRTIRGSLQTAPEEVRGIQGPYEVCYGASTSYGVVHDVLSETGAPVVVAPPGKLRLLYRSTDKHDRADAKTKQRIAWLGAVAFAQAGDALARDEHLERLRWLATAIRRAGRELDRIARKHPGVALLRTIPGVGNRTAEAVAAWLGGPPPLRPHQPPGGLRGAASAQPERLAGDPPRPGGQGPLRRRARTTRTARRSPSWRPCTPSCAGCTRCFARGEPLRSSAA